MTLAEQIDALPGRIAAALVEHRDAREILDVPQAAAFLGISKDSVYRGLQEGRIPGRQVGQRWIVSRSALLEWAGCKSLGTEEKGT